MRAARRLQDHPHLPARTPLAAMALAAVLLASLAGCVEAPPPSPIASPPPGAQDPVLARDAALDAAIRSLPGAGPVRHLRVATQGGPVDVALLGVPDTVFFDFGVAAPRADAAPALDAIARAVLASPPGSVLTIAGNTDAVGSADFNQALSEERARNVVAELEARGVPDAALAAIGYGRDRPVASNATPEGRARNRRVELALSASFAANRAALEVLAPIEAAVPDAPPLPEPLPGAAATQPARPGLARRPAPLSIHPNRPASVRPNSLGPNVSY